MFRLAVLALALSLAASPAFAKKEKPVPAPGYTYDGGDPSEPTSPAPTDPVGDSSYGVQPGTTYSDGTVESGGGVLRGDVDGDGQLSDAEDADIHPAYGAGPTENGTERQKVGSGGKRQESKTGKVASGSYSSSGSGRGPGDGPGSNR